MSRDRGSDDSPLEPGSTARLRLGQEALRFVDAFIEGRADAPASFAPIDAATLNALTASPPESGGELAPLLALVQAATETGIDTASGKHLSFIPSGGLYTSAIASFVAAATNRYTGGSFASPGSIAIEQSVIRWLIQLFDYPQDAAGVLLSGGSLANFTAAVVARSRFGDDFRNGTVYASERAHHSVEKAARLAGIASDRIRFIPANESLQIDVDALRRQMALDRGAGLRPMLIAATAGTTDTGAIDPIQACAAAAREVGAWFHVDAAYGGFFTLTERGRARLRGIEEADSITIDAHKSLFLPFGTGGLVVRDGGALVTAHEGRGSYMQDVTDEDDLPHYFALGPELTRPFRGLSLWLPLHLHGVGAFRAELDRMLDLAEWAAREIAAIPGLELAAKPDLSIVAFRSTGGEDSSKRIMDFLNQSEDLHVSSTTVHGKFTLRLAFLSQRTVEAVAERAVELLRNAVDA